MPNKGQNSGGKTSPSGNGWIAGMIAGQLLTFAAAILLKESMPAMLALVLTGSIVGGIMGTLQKAKKAPAPLRDKRIRAHVFEALTITSKKLDEIIIDEQFNGAAGSESDRRAMKQEAKPKLAPPMPAPPKMGGML